MVIAGEVEGRPHVQDAGIDMAEHAVGKAGAIEQCAELADIGREVFRRHGGILDEGDGPDRPVHIAEQADRPFAHRPDRLDIGMTPRDRIAQATRHCARGERRSHLGQLAVEFGFVVGEHFGDIDAVCGSACIVGKKRAMPVQTMSPLARPRTFSSTVSTEATLSAIERSGILQCRVEVPVADVDQCRMGGDRQKIEFGFGDHRQRSLGAAENGIQVETSVAVGGCERGRNRSYSG